MPTRLVARPDDSQLAYCHAGRLGVVDAAMHELAAIDLTQAPSWIGFVGDQLAALHGDELVAYNLPSLAEATRCPVPPGVTVRATVGERLALSGDGLDVLVARMLGKKIDLSTFSMTAPAHHIVGLEDNQLMVVNARGTELIDAVSKRVTGRLQLPLPPAPREIGATHQLRYVWMFRPGRPEIVVVRLSDGRPFQQTLDGGISEVHASVTGPWVVAVTGAGPRRVHVQTLAAHALEVDVSRAACVTGGAEPSLYWIDAGLRMQRTSLSGQAVLSAAGGGRVGSGGVKMEVEPMGTVKTFTAPAPAPSTSTSTSTSTPTPTPTTTTTSSGTTVAVLKVGWRLLVAEWARGVLQGKDPAMPAMERVMADLVRRAGLNVEGGRALMLLYGAWVAGEPRVSLAVAARTVAWDEVAGSGSLPRAGLSEVVDGKVRVKSVVARYLDGATVERVRVHGSTPRPDVAPGRQLAPVSADLPVMGSARGLAERMGAAAIVDEVRARSAAELAEAIDEAWLRGLPVIAVPGLELDAQRLAAAPLRPDHTLVIVWPDEAAPVALEELPRIES